MLRTVYYFLTISQENGPCKVNPDNQTTVINPHSWNNISNSRSISAIPGGRVLILSDV